MNAINKEEAIKYYMTKTKDELAEMLWNCYENSLPHGIEKLTKISYSFDDVDNIMYDMMSDDKYIQIFNDLMNVDETNAMLYPDVPIKCICKSFEDMCNHYLLENIDKPTFLNLLKEDDVNTTDEYFLIERTNGNISIKSGDNINYLINYGRYVRNVYDICFNNKNIYEPAKILSTVRMRNIIDEIKNYLIEEIQKRRGLNNK